MRALLAHLTMFHHHDQIGIGNGGQAVRNGDHRPPLPHFTQRILNVALGLGVQRARRLVQNQDAGVLQQGPRDADPLLFSARQFQPAFTDLGIVAIGQRHHKVMDLGRPRRLLDLFARRIRVAVGNVVIDRVVEQHGILRHHANRLMQAGLRHITDILPVDANGTAGDVIEPEQQPPHGRLATARGSDQGDPLPGSDPQRYPAQDFAVGVIGEFHVLKHHLARRDLQIRSARLVGDFRRLAQQPEHFAHIHQSLPNFTVHCSQKAQRQGDLHHIGVDHDEIADRETARLHADGRHHHHDDQAGGDDHVLPDVQHRQTLPGAHGKTLIGRHRAVITRGFPCLGIEIFYGFIVQQAVDRLLVGIGVLIIHRPPDRNPPFGNLESVRHVDRDRHDHDNHVLPAEIQREDHRYHGQFQDQRPDGKQHEAQQEIDTLDPALDHPAQTTGLAGDVIAHRQQVDVLKRFQRQLAQRALPDPHKDPVAHLAKKHCAHPRQTIGNCQTDRPQQQKCRRIGILPGQRINGAFVKIRGRDRDKL